MKTVTKVDLITGIFYASLVFLFCLMSLSVIQSVCVGAGAGFLMVLATKIFLW